MNVPCIAENSGKAIHLSYEDNLKLIAFKQQAAVGPFNANHAPALGVLDVIGRDRQQHWQLLGDITREQAMEGFIDLLDTMCSAFRPYIEAVRQNRDENLKAELRRMELEKEARQKREREQQELLEEGYKEELQRRQLQDALNKQTYQQFKVRFHNCDTQSIFEYHVHQAPCQAGMPDAVPAYVTASEESLRTKWNIYAYMLSFVFETKFKKVCQFVCLVYHKKKKLYEQLEQIRYTLHIFNLKTSYIAYILYINY